MTSVRDLASDNRHLQQLRDLHGIQRGTLEQLIARYPKSEAVLKRAIATYSTNFAVVLSGNVQWHRVTISRGLIDQLQAGRFRQDFVCSLDRHRLGEFCTDCD